LLFRLNFSTRCLFKLVEPAKVRSISKFSIDKDF
jgi:hypothetical protein